MNNSTSLWTPGTPAYSYLLFSTPEQQNGDSFRRQSSMAASYAGRHGLELDEELTFHDLGRSAFRGQNLAEAGRLADFLEAVHSGLVARGSVLLVEQLDRISRQSARKALRALESIVDAGVAVVTLNDERAYTATSLDEDPMDLLVAILTFMRANEESATKARRVKAAWEAKRQAASTTLLTKRAPSWLKISADGSGFARARRYPSAHIRGLHWRNWTTRHRREPQPRGLRALGLGEALAQELRQQAPSKPCRHRNAGPTHDRI